MTRKITVKLTDTIEVWRNATNTMAEYVGDPDNLNTTNKNDLVQAINEIASATTVVGFTSALSLTNTGNGNHTQLTYDSGSGQFSFNSNAVGPTHLAPLPATVITSGVFPQSRIPTLTAASVTSGVFAAARIPPITQLSGSLAPGQVGFATQDVPESPSALYYTDARARAAIYTDSNLFMDSSGKLGIELSPATLASIAAFEGLAGTGVTIGALDSISIGQDIGVTNSPTFVGVTASSVTTSTLNCTGTASFTGTVSGTALGGGIVASDAVADAGTANDVAITPAQLARQISPNKTIIFRSTYMPLSSFTGTVQIPLPISWSVHPTHVSQGGYVPMGDHGLPDFVTYRLRRNVYNANDQGGYVSGEMIDIYPNNTADISGNGTAFRAEITGQDPGMDYGGFKVSVANDGPGYALGKSNSSNYFKIDNGRWDLQIIAVRFGEGVA